MEIKSRHKPRKGRILLQFKINDNDIWYKIELKVYVNQHYFISDIHAHDFLLCFHHELVMSFTTY